MKALPPGNSDPNQQNQTGYDHTEKQVQNEQQVSWADWINNIHRKYPDLFQWLLDLFGINHWLSYNPNKEIENAITNPQTLFDGFYKIQQEKKAIDLDKGKLKSEIERANHLRQFLVNLFEIKSWQFWEQTSELEKALSNPQTLFEAFSKLQQYTSSIEQSKQNTSNLNYQLHQKNHQIHTLQQEIESLRRENRSTNQLQSRIDDLERENQELYARVSSLMSKLSARDRDKTITITSNDSIPQRDALTQKFIQINNQFFNAASNDVFNHLLASQPNLKAYRKRETARIKFTLAKMVFIEARELFTRSNSLLQQDFPQTVQMFTDKLLQNLGMPERVNCPPSIIKSLENLIEEVLKLVKDIVNDEPPGELFIENEGTVFNPERHQPVPGCEPSGRILYTTYPGYCINNRILGDAFKAFVFTVPEAEFNSRTASDIASKDVARKNDSANISDEIENKQVVHSNSSADDTVSGSQQQETENSSSVIQKLEALKKAGLSDVDIAGRLQTNSQTVYHWIIGKHHPQKENLEKIDKLYKEVCENNCTQ
ncbi:MAG: hypothetical protein EAZ78_16000 [Oscillatoriales cyanobacterium]|nr:MAG: hypothetical protein EAZ78_16000 [Oscillatoriales cyanobacterium]TAF59024.1 MAG: hypothetical protein EAZ59_28355 [Oscillatoriales cyanobacterium]